MRFRNHNPAIPEADMTPMIDVVFQLISFFMLVTNFEQTQADERVKLPIDALAEPPKAVRETDLVVNIGFFRNEDGSLADTTPYVFRGDEQFTIPDFRRFLHAEAELIEFKSGVAALQETAIVIRADREVPFGSIQEFMEIAQQEQFEKFSLKARQAE